MAQVFSAGVLLHRCGADGALQVLIGHPGGPFWARKDDGAWSIAKGEYDSGDDPWEAARREFAEEVGQPVPDGSRTDLGEITQPSGKRLHVYAVRADLDISELRSNTFLVEWPRGSGRTQEFPELDRVTWLPIEEARVKLLRGQRGFVDRLLGRVGQP